MSADRQGGKGGAAASLAGGAPGPQGSGPRAIGAAVSRVAGPIVRKRGGGVLVRLKSEWAAIVGAPWSEVAWPVALGRGGVLKLRAAPAAALELQHRSPLLLERINSFFGRPVATRLALVQGPLPLAAPTAAPPPAAAPETAAVEELVADVRDPALRQALARLGRAVLAARR